MQHQSHHLYKQLPNIFSHFPNGVTSIPHQLQGSSFFPAGVGLLIQEKLEFLPKFPIGGVMVLGQDWGTVKDFDTFKLKDAENLKNRTWSNMLELFRRAELDTRNCFFTNFFIGLRTGKSSVGRFPGASDIHYVKKCVTFFLNQVEIQKPRLILVLGAHIPKYLSTASSYLKEWQFFQNYKKLDKEGNAIIHCDDFNSIKHSCVLLSLVHPCYRQLNARHRNWEGLNGDAAELAMLRSAMASSGILSR